MTDKFIAVNSKEEAEKAFAYFEGLGYKRNYDYMSEYDEAVTSVFAVTSVLAEEEYNDILYCCMSLEIFRLVAEEHLLPVEELYPAEKLGYRVGDKFVITEDVRSFNKGDFIYLVEDDFSNIPLFSKDLEGYCFLRDCWYVDLTTVNKIAPVDEAQAATISIETLTEELIADIEASKPKDFLKAFKEFREKFKGSFTIALFVDADIVLTFDHYEFVGDEDRILDVMKKLEDLHD
jgi:hypothetical protein